MYPFTHVNAYSIEEAKALLKDGKAAVIAGGTDLLTTMNGMCISEANAPTTLVNIKTINGLKGITTDSSTGALKIGALTTLSEIADSPIVKDNQGWKVLAEAALKAASPELRNAGTIGGNICQKPRCIYYRKEYNFFNCLRKRGGENTCYAANGLNRFHSIFGSTGSGCYAICPSDTAPALVALGAKIITSNGEWDAKDFFYVGDRYDQINDIAADEIVKEIVVPAPAAGAKSTYLKFAFRKAIDFPLVSVAVVANTSNGTVSDASIVLGGVFNMPYRATKAESSINGKAITETNAADAGTAGLQDNLANEAPQAKYKVQVAKTLIKRALLAL